MDKQKLLLAALSDLKLAVENLEAVITGDREPEQTGTQEKQEITLEQVRAILAEKSRAGHSDKIKALIKSCGAYKLTEVDPKYYADLIASAEAL